MWKESWVSMEEIKVGEYVRTKKGIIDKVIVDYKGKCNNPNCKEKHISCEKDYYDEKDIVKHSFNIIDLIEVGDYVNGFEVTQNAEDTPEEQCDGVYHKCIIVKQSFDGVKGWKMIDFDIETIVTKEQFESMEYKVGD